MKTIIFTLAILAVALARDDSAEDSSQIRVVAGKQTCRVDNEFQNKLNARLDALKNQLVSLGSEIGKVAKLNDVVGNLENKFENFAGKFKFDHLNHDGDEDRSNIYANEHENVNGEFRFGGKKNKVPSYSGQAQASLADLADSQYNSNVNPINGKKLSIKSPSIKPSFSLGGDY